MTRYLICLLALILATVAACAPSAPSANTPVWTQPSSAAAENVTPARGAVPTVEPTVAPKPLNVQVQVDSKVSASAVITTTGGSVSVQAADGTKFTLTFPNGAVLEEVKVTLTPVTRVDGLPFSGGLVGGVHMAPEGLRLLQAAKLTIESARAVAARGYETVAFGYHEQGEGMYLNTSEVKGDVMTVEVWHFSGVGAAQGTAAEIEAQQQRNVPSNAEDALVQRVGEYVRREHEAQERGEQGDPEWGKRMGEFAREYYDQFVGPQLPVALQDCEAAPEILSKAVGWMRQVTLLGMEKDFEAEDALIWETLFQATVNCYNKEYDQCVIDNDIKHRVTMLGYFRQAMLLGIDDRLDYSKINKCAPRYRVDTLIGGEESKVPLRGVICDLEKPFALKSKGQNLSGGQWDADFTFTPTGESGGSWKQIATSCIPGYACVTVSAGGTYQLVGVADGNPVLMMAAHTGTGEVKGYVGVGYAPAYEFELHPTTEDCSAE